MISFKQYFNLWEATSRRDFLKMLSGAAAGVASLGRVPAAVSHADDMSDSFWFRTCAMCGQYSKSPLKGGMRAFTQGTNGGFWKLTSDNWRICSSCWSIMDKYWRDPARQREAQDRKNARRDPSRHLKKLDIPLKTWAQRKLPHTFTSNDRGEYDYDDVVRGVSEARSQPGEPVEGIDRFIEWMELAKGDLMTPGLIADIRAFIDKSGCPKIKFERLSGALGISTEAECVVSSGSLNSSMTQMLYVIFHELAHQYQYSKHGEDFAGDIFLGDKSALESAKDLLKIENIADRYAHRIVKHLMDKHNLKFDGIHLVYKNYTPAEIAVHVNGVRNMVKQQGLTTVEAVNQFIYNMIKTVVKPTIKTRTYSSSTNDK